MRTETESTALDDEFDDLLLMNIQVVKPVFSAHQGGIMLDVKVNTKPLKMELDIGASVTIDSDKTWREELGGLLWCGLRCEALPLTAEV